MRRPILRMDKIHASLEDIFVELTSAKDGAVVYEKRQADAEFERQLWEDDGEEDSKDILENISDDAGDSKDITANREDEEQ